MDIDEQIEQLFLELEEKLRQHQEYFSFSSQVIRGDVDRSRDRRRIDSSELDPLVTKMYEEGNSTFDISIELDISQAMVMYSLRRSKTPRRTVAEAVSLSHKHGKGTNRYITIDRKSLMIVEWSKISGTPANQITQRLSRGWTPYEAVFTPSLTRQCEHGRRQMDCARCGATRPMPERGYKRK